MIYTDHELLKFSKTIFNLENCNCNIDNLKIDNIDNLFYEHKLYPFIYKHKIRFENFIDENAQKYIAVALMQRVLDINIIKAISSKIIPKDDPIILKGIGPYLLTGDLSLLKISGDIDIIVEHPDELARCIAELGGKKISSTCCEHEEGKYLYRERMIESHFWVPGIKLPRDPLSTREGQTKYKIHYEDIYNESKVIHGIRFPNFEMSTFIIITHLYMDFYWRVYKFPRVCLQELYTVYKLIKHISFRVEKFREIVSKFNAWEVVSFVGKILDSYFPEQVLKGCEDKLVNVQPYIKLMNCAHSSYVISSQKNYFSNIPVIRFDDILADLHPTEIELNCYYNTKLINCYEFSENVCCDFSYVFSVSVKRNCIKVTFEFDYILENDDSIAVFFENNYGHFRYKKNKEAQIFGLYNGSKYYYECSEERTRLVYEFNNLIEESLYNSAVISVEHYEKGKMSQITIPILFKSI